MKARLLLIASIAALLALSVPLLAQARSGRAARIGHTHRSTLRRHVSRAHRQALAAAESPRAVYLRPGQTSASGPSGTTFVQIAPGLTLRQAVGLAPIPAETLAKLRGNVLPCPCGGGGYWSGCSTKSYTRGFGDWPWNVSITDYTTWCGQGGVLTSKTMKATQTAAAECTPTGMDYGVVLGGIGKLNEDWKDVGQWSCTTPWGHEGATDWMEMHVDANGPSDYSYVTSYTQPLGG